jgi:hypothetical protein
LDTISRSSGRDVGRGVLDIVKTKYTRLQVAEHREGVTRRIQAVNIIRFALCWDQWDCLSVTHISFGPFGTSAHAPTPGELCGILTALSDTLRSLTMRGTWRGSRDGTTFNGPITLKALTSLTTSTGWEPHVRDVLEGCRFPALEHIDTHISLLGNLPSTLINFSTFRRTQTVSFG